MKAYVIKNKEGKYFAGFDNYNVFVTEKDITNAVMYRADRYEKYELENSPEFEDCEVVEITIAEGDLEKQLAEKDKEIKRQQKNALVALNKLNDENKELKKEIEELKKDRNWWKEEHRLADKFNKELCEKYCYPAQELEPQLRHQICEEIRNKLPYFKYSFQEPEVPRVDVIEMRDIEFILDEIEGEIK